MNDASHRSMAMPQKSAFDDLNDSISAALNLKNSASPSQNVMSFGSGAVVQKDQMHQPVAGLFSSSSQQHPFAQPQMFTSATVVGHDTNVPSSAFGGGSQ